MTGKKTKWSIDEKIRMVMQTFNPQTVVADLCRQNNIAPRTIYTWREKFLAGGRTSLDGSDAVIQARRHRKEVESLKRIIGEYAVANAALKKTLEGEAE